MKFHYDYVLNRNILGIMLTLPLLWSLWNWYNPVYSFNTSGKYFSFILAARVSSGVMFAPVVEELVFRGFVLHQKILRSTSIISIAAITILSFIPTLQSYSPSNSANTLFIELLERGVITQQNANEYFIFISFHSVQLYYILTFIVVIFFSFLIKKILPKNISHFTIKIVAGISFFTFLSLHFSTTDASLNDLVNISLYQEYYAVVIATIGYFILAIYKSLKSAIATHLIYNFSIELPLALPFLWAVNRPAFSLVLFAYLVAYTMYGHYLLEPGQSKLPTNKDK